MEERQKQFEGKSFLNLESFRRNGLGVKTPVWFTQDGETFYVRTIAGSGKVKRIRNNGEVRIVPCEASGTPTGEWVAAQAVEASVPMSMGFGLFQGDKLSAASTAAYRRLIQDTFLQRLVYRVEEQLRTSGRDNPELQYEGLKAYLMFHDPQHFYADAIKVWVTADWDRNLPRDVPVEDRKALEAHLDTLFARGPVNPPLPADAQLIHQLRTQLAALPLPQRVYSRLKRQGVGADIPEFRISQVAGPAAPLMIERASGAPLTQGVPGLFTYDGHHKAFVKEAEKVTRQLAEEESWVMGITDRHCRQNRGVQER